MSIIKPENAKRRADDLLAVGSTDDAIAVLHDLIVHKRFKFLPLSDVIENIVIDFLRLCVSSNKLKHAKDGLIQYRNLCKENGDPLSLQRVIEKFREFANDRVRQAISKAEKKALDNIHDLEAEDPPEAILLSAIHDEVSTDTDSPSESRFPGTSNSNKDHMELHHALRFMWEVYKMILDTVHKNRPLEQCYHDTAQRALEFCKEHNRPTEFKKLCDNLRLHYTNLLKLPNKDSAYVDVTFPNTIARFLDTRLSQLAISVEMNLYKESYQTCEDVHELFRSVTRPNPRHKSDSLKYLAYVFRITKGAELLHCVALIRYLQHTQMFKKKKLEGIELETSSSECILAYLSVPLIAKSNNTYISSSDLDVDTIQASRELQWSKLLGLTNIPSRTRVATELIQRNILSESSDVVKRLFSLLESDVVPMNICVLVDQLLSQVPAELREKYGETISANAFICLLNQLSRVYSSLSLTRLQEKFVPNKSVNEIEKILSKYACMGSVTLKLDIANNRILFGNIATNPAVAFYHQHLDTAKILSLAMQKGISADERHKDIKKIIDLEKSYLCNSENRRIQEKHIIDERKSEISNRNKMRNDEQLQRENEMRKRLESERAKEEENLKRIQEMETKQREQDRIRDEKEKRELAKKEELITDFKTRLCTPQSVLKTIDIKGLTKKIEDLSINDVANISVDDIERIFIEHNQKERRERIKIRRNDAKKLDHITRALRLQILPLLDKFQKEIYQKDVASQEEQIVHLEEEHKHIQDKVVVFDQVIGSAKQELQEWFKRQ